MKIVKPQQPSIPKQLEPPSQPSPPPEHPAVMQARRHFEAAIHAVAVYHEEDSLKKRGPKHSFERFENKHFVGYALLEDKSAVLYLYASVL